MNKPPIQQPSTSYIFHYPQAEVFSNRQLATLWFASEIDVEKDVHCILTELTPAQRHGITTVLRLFTAYELSIGVEYWSGIIAKNFPRPEIQKMASIMSFMELAVHAPMYAKINEALGLATDEFYTSYVDDPVLNDRVEFIEETVKKSKTNLPLSLAVFSIVEGAILYSSFAFIKHFQSNGNNLMVNISTGINSSEMDEDLHSQAGAWLFREYIKELKLSKEQLDQLQEDIFVAATKLIEHEYRIIDMIFEQGNMQGITAEQLRAFVQHRVAYCLNNLGYEYNLPETHDNTIEKWFYSNKNFKLHDFFNRTEMSSYVRGWKPSSFKWSE